MDFKDYRIPLKKLNLENTKNPGIWDPRKIQSESRLWRRVLFNRKKRENPRSRQPESPVFLAYRALSDFIELQRIESAILPKIFCELSIDIYLKLEFSKSYKIFFVASKGCDLKGIKIHFGFQESAFHQRHS